MLRRLFTSKEGGNNETPRKVDRKPTNGERDILERTNPSNNRDEMNRIDSSDITHREETNSQHQQRGTQRPMDAQCGSLRQGASRSTDDVTPDALQVLKTVGIGYNIAMKIFYLARIVHMTEEIYEHIVQYVDNGLEHGYNLKIRNILRLVRNGEIEFQHHQELSKVTRMILWHGTTKEKIGKILVNGFQLPQPSGQMFGPGIYFADRVSKSANYCTQDRNPGNIAYLLLCDVLLGNVYNARKPHNDLTEAPNHTTRTFDSVKCTGERIPDPKYDLNFLGQGSTMPCGATITNKRFKYYTVAFNEFIVYSTQNIRIKFLVEVEFIK